MTLRRQANRISAGVQTSCHNYGGLINRRGRGCTEPIGFRQRLTVHEDLADRFVGCDLPPHMPGMRTCVG